MKKSIVSLLFVGIFLCALSAEQRTALVIGNAEYETAPLKKTINDAKDMAQTLRDLGFSVTTKLNVGHKEMFEAIRDFGNALVRLKFSAQI